MCKHAFTGAAIERLDVIYAHQGTYVAADHEVEEIEKARRGFCELWRERDARAAFERVLKEMQRLADASVCDTDSDCPAGSGASDRLHNATHERCLASLRRPDYCEAISLATQRTSIKFREPRGELDEAAQA